MIVSTDPTTNPHDLRDPESFFFNYNLDLGLALVKVVQEQLEPVSTEWATVLDHIEGLLAEGLSICSPQAHDLLLVDDENLTRSKKYFWIMTSIDEFTILVDRTAQALEQLYRDHVPSPEERKEQVVRLMLEDDEAWTDIDVTHERLILRYNSYLHRLEEQRRRTELFRNGVSIPACSSLIPAFY